MWVCSGVCRGCWSEVCMCGMCAVGCVWFVVCVVCVVRGVRGEIYGEGCVFRMWGVWCV